MPVKIVDRHPDADRFDALSTGALTGMIGLTFAFLVVGLARVPSPLSLVVLLVGIAPAVWSITRWVSRRRSHTLIYLRGLPRGWTATVQSMAANVDALNQLLSHTPPGPVADHLAEVSMAAQGSLRTCVARAEVAHRDSLPDHEVIRDQNELHELTRAAHSLRATHESLLIRQPLVELTERTERIEAALAGDLDGVVTDGPMRDERSSIDGR